jgi:hypothetical protein
MVGLIQTHNLELKNADQRVQRCDNPAPPLGLGAWIAVERLARDQQGVPAAQNATVIRARRWRVSAGTVTDSVKLRPIPHLLKHLLHVGQAKLAGVALLQPMQLAGGDLARLIAFGSAAWKARMSSTKRRATAGW